MSLIRVLCALTLMLGLSAPLVAESTGDVAIRARAVFKKHCAECHDGQVASRSSLVILDHPQLVNKDRKLPPFVKPKTPNASQIIEFIEDGSMPPGGRLRLTPDEVNVLRTWIEAGATAYPQRFDDAFAHAAILADIEAHATDRKNYRYFSLHHLADDPAADLPKAREAFRLAVNSVAKKEGDALKQPIDPTGTIYRVDLRELGWDATPFRVLDPTGKTGPDGKNLPSRLTIFDLLLLEYPHAEMPPESNSTVQLAELWLRPIEQIRPVIFVQADWFAAAVTGTPLKNDINLLRGGGAKARGAVPTKMEFELRPEDLPNIPIRRLTKSIPINPLDAFYANDVDAKDGPKVTIKITDANSKAIAKLGKDEPMQMEILSDQTVWIELIQIRPNGNILNYGDFRVEKNVEKKVVFVGMKGGLKLGDHLGKHRFIVFAAADKFAAGEILECEIGDDLEIDRYVHRFYQLPKKLGDPPPGFNPSKMIRKTAIVEVIK